MEQEWEGKERRTQMMFSKEFYDKMIELHSDMKHLIKWTSDHESKDDKRFDDTTRKVDWVTKVAYLGIGGLMAFQFIINFVFKK